MRLRIPGSVEEQSARLQKPADGAQNLKRIFDMLQHFDSRDHIKGTGERGEFLTPAESMAFISAVPGATTRARGASWLAGPHVALYVAGTIHAARTLACDHWGLEPVRTRGAFDR